MAELDSLLQVLMVAGYPGSLVVIGAIGYKIWSNLKELTAAYRVLNHNSSLIVKVLLAKGLISPEDVKDIEV